MPELPDGREEMGQEGKQKTKQQQNTHTHI